MDTNTHKDAHWRILALSNMIKSRRWSDPGVLQYGVLWCPMVSYGVVPSSYVLQYCEMDFWRYDDWCADRQIGAHRRPVRQCSAFHNQQATHGDTLLQMLTPNHLLIITYLLTLWLCEPWYVFCQSFPLPHPAIAPCRAVLQPALWCEKLWIFSSFWILNLKDWHSSNSANIVKYCQYVWTCLKYVEHAETC